MKIPYHEDIEPTLENSTLIMFTLRLVLSNGLHKAFRVYLNVKPDLDQVETNSQPLVSGF